VYNYNAYNLGISSVLPLPELEPSAEAAADVVIQLGQIEWSPEFDSAYEDEPVFAAESNVVHFFWSELGKFSVIDGCRIVIDPVAGVEERLLRLPLLGAVFAVLLHQRKRLVLHASAISIDGGAVLFLGQKGQGKSTTAATLFGRGHQMIADDIVAVSVDAMGQPTVAPAYPQFKLYPEAAACAVGGGALTKLAEGYQKYGRRITDRFVQHPVPLDRIYVLRTKTETSINLLDPQSALLALMSNSYVARFGKRLLGTEPASLHLQQCARVMRHVPVYNLERPMSLTDLHLVAGLIEEHVESYLPEFRASLQKNSKRITAI
jgi:hypothetical protein